MSVGDIKCNTVTTDDWVGRWDKRQIGFHKDHVHPLLQKHSSTMVNNRSNMKIFFPLCGKALDMKWFADQGHTVIGVEAAKLAIEEFFAEQKVTYTTQPVPAINGTLFQSEDKRLNIYNCDFYKFTKEIAGQMDGMWDRGALVAINNAEREKYAVVMRGLMAPDCRYLISALQYDDTKYGGPPHHLADSAIQELYSSSCDIKMIEDTDAFEPGSRQETAWGIDWMREKIFLVTLK